MSFRRPAAAAAPDFAAALIASADVARDDHRYVDAAALYGEALRIHPGNVGIRVQAGHMYKEAGDFPTAERHYAAAAAITPLDADLAQSFGHLYKLMGRLADATLAYERAAALAPDWTAPAAELAHLKVSGWPGSASPGLDPRSPATGPSVFEVLAARQGAAAPELLPRGADELAHRAREGIELRQFGVRRHTFWGNRPVLRGVEAIRGFGLSVAPLIEVQALVNGLMLHRGPLKGPYELQYEPDKTRIHKYVFNIWCDLSSFVPGLYELELRLIDAARQPRSLRDLFVIEPPLLEADHPDSDGVVERPASPGVSIEDQVRARPSIVHRARRGDLAAKFENVLVLRVDQLGDLIASVPGLRRLRELLPRARIVGAVGPANVELARTLDLFDELIVIDLPESLVQRARVLDAPAQEALRARLEPYRFDLAIDLASSTMSRPLLALTGAPFLYGFSDPNWGRLTASLGDAFHDPKNGGEIAPHSARVLALVERLGALLSSKATVIRRADLARERLGAFGLEGAQPYAVLHTGARIAFSRWPGFVDLAGLILDRTSLEVVMFGDDALGAALPSALTASARFRLIRAALPFDDFDALLSFCTVFVGNDSGPKHLAALRGAPVVSLHSARINWGEWGQEQTGVVISRKVPCAGCSLYHDVEDCGKDHVCVTDIAVAEVFDAVMRHV